MLVVVETGTSGWEIVGVFAQITAAGAAAIAAWAAWRAAGAAQQTSRESRQALGAALRPNLRAQFSDHPATVVEGAERLLVVVQNISEWDAKDVQVEVVYRDGESIKNSTEHLGSRIRDVNEEFRIPLRLAVSEEQLAYLQLARITVRWSDSQRIGRYELEQEFTGDEQARMRESVRQIESV